tara:strand:- start:5631 stop:6302 length:672 start_codon:yes stop_codon:yes gene_type:complete
MATPRRRRRSVAEIEALANKPTRAKSPAPKPKRKPAKTVAEIERRANKPTPSKAKVAMKRQEAVQKRMTKTLNEGGQTSRSGKISKLFPRFRRRETAIEREAEKRQHTPEMRHIYAAAKTGELRRLQEEDPELRKALLKGGLKRPPPKAVKKKAAARAVPERGVAPRGVARPKRIDRGVPPRGGTRMLDRPQHLEPPAQVAPTPNLGVFGRTVPKRGVPRRRR